MKKHLLLLLFSTLFAHPILYAQDSTKIITRSIEGQIWDNLSNAPIPNAQIDILDFSPLKTTNSDSLGFFSLDQIALGRYRLLISCPNYEDIVVPDVILTSGKQVPLNIAMTATVAPKEVPSKPKPLVNVLRFTTKDKGRNEMALSGVRLFTINEVERYTGARDDPQRLAANFAGMRAYTNEFTELIARGQSSLGVRYWVEGVPVYNINHLPNSVSTGGVFPLLNQNLLRDSEIQSGSYAAEYGSGSAPLFDIKLRAGNKNNAQFLGQISITALEATLEAPLGRQKQNSFIVSYRRAIFPILTLAKIKLISEVPDYQDAHLKFDFPQTKAGSFSLFAIFGNGNLIAKNSTNTAVPNIATNFSWLQTFSGLQHQYQFSRYVTLNTTLGFSYFNNKTYLDSIGVDTAVYPNIFHHNINSTFNLSSHLTVKLATRHSLRTGLLATLSHLQYQSGLQKNVDWAVDYNNYVSNSYIYAQIYSKWSSKITTNFGVNIPYFSIGNQIAISPRANIRWNTAPAHTLNAGYALMADSYVWQAFLQQQRLPNGNMILPNKHLKLAQNHQFTAEHIWRISDNWRLRTEGFAYLMYKVPISTDSLHPIIYNNITSTDAEISANFPAFVNKAKGRSLGIETTVEKFFSHGFYGLLTATLFDTRYKGYTPEWTNATFNSNYIVSFLAGKEFDLGRRSNAITIDSRIFYGGGYYFTPIDLAASRSAGSTVLDWSNYQGERSKDQFRWDLKLGFRLNGRKSTHIFFIDAYNILDSKNTIWTRYNYITQNPHLWTTTGRIIFFTYRLRLNFSKG